MNERHGPWRYTRFRQPTPRENPADRAATTTLSELHFDPSAFPISRGPNQLSLRKITSAISLLRSRDYASGTVESFETCCQRRGFNGPERFCRNPKASNDVSVSRSWFSAGCTRKGIWGRRAPWGNPGLEVRIPVSSQSAGRIRTDPIQIRRDHTVCG